MEIIRDIHVGDDGKITLVVKVESFPAYQLHHENPEILTLGIENAVRELDESLRELMACPIKRRG